MFEFRVRESINICHSNGPLRSECHDDGHTWEVVVDICGGRGDLDNWGQLVDPNFVREIIRHYNGNLNQHGGLLITHPNDPLFGAKQDTHLAPSMENVAEALYWDIVVQLNKIPDRVAINAKGHSVHFSNPTGAVSDPRNRR